jgi:competence protein ComEC
VPKFLFFRLPFVVLASGLALGTVLGFLLRATPWLPVFVFLLVFTLSTCLIWVWKKQTTLRIAVYFSMFSLLGALNMQIQLGVWGKVIPPDKWEKDALLSVRLDQVDQKDKPWKKATGRVKSIYIGKATIQVDVPLVLFIEQGKLIPKNGDLLLIPNEIEPIRNAGNPGEFDSEVYWYRKGYFHQAFIGNGLCKRLEKGNAGTVSFWLESMRIWLKSQLEKQLDGNELAIGLALILGDKSLIDGEITANFTNTGAMHVLAVSGLHIGLIMQFLLLVLSQFHRWVSRNQAILLVVVLMWIYAFITGFSPSVIRAVFMFSVLVMAQLLSKAQEPINTLFFTGFLLVLLDPYMVFDIGFQLSFLAMLGIYLFYRPIEQFWYIKNGIGRYLWQGTAVGFAAQLMTTPLSLYYFHQFPNYFILTNIGLMASSGIILGLGMTLFALGWLWWFGKFIGYLLAISVFLSYVVVEWTSALPGSVAYGFQLSFFEVILLGILACWLFLPKPKPIYQFSGYFLLVGILALLAYRRYDNMQLDEVCILNARQAVIILKHEQRIFCFYRCKPKDFKKVELAVRNYAKIHPGEIKYCDLEDQKWKLEIDGKTFTIERTRNTLELNLPDKQIDLVMSDYAEPRKGGITIGMPWIKVPVYHRLSSGAFRKSISLK